MEATSGLSGRVSENIIRRFTYTGEEIIPDDVTHVFVNVKVVPPGAFRGHHSIREIICHENVEKIEEHAFDGCTNLIRVIMPGVKTVEKMAFDSCESLRYIECKKLKKISRRAFVRCTSLQTIALPSAEIFQPGLFSNCNSLMYARFGCKLKSFNSMAFFNCRSLKVIVVPMKYNLITDDTVFMQCGLKYAYLVEEVEVKDTISALQLQEWRNDMNEEFHSINQILPDAAAGSFVEGVVRFGEKAQVIRRWIRSVLHKINHYQAEHKRLLNEAANTIQLFLPRDIVRNNVLSFLDLPSHTFEFGDHEDEDNNNDDSLSGNEG